MDIALVRAAVKKCFLNKAGVYIRFLHQNTQNYISGAQHI
jgi:hypothetical protein